MSTNNGNVVQVSKDFPVSKEALYKAWTEEQQLKEWWKPMNKQLQKVENDIREGGRVAYHFDENLQIKGEYKEVAEGDKLVYSWNWELPEDSVHRGEYLLTVAFSGDGDKSTLDITQENFQHEHSIKPHTAGWEEALEHLHRYLSSRSNA